jgi:transcriptional regulator with XRE-family HTH domain
VGNRPILNRIRAKKLGVLVRSARISSGKSREECSQALGVDSETFSAYELGEKSPSLPEIEALAYYLDLPVDYFWSEDVAPEAKKPIEPADLERLMGIRQRIIGALIKQARLQSGLSLDELTEKAGLSNGNLAAYELGEVQIPLPELEAIAQVLDRSITDFHTDRGPIGDWSKQQRILSTFSELSPALQEFITKPINRPYLDLALRLSEMSVEKLRAVAEGLLEITL